MDGGERIDLPNGSVAWAPCYIGKDCQIGSNVSIGCLAHVGRNVTLGAVSYTHLTLPTIYSV